ncbi:hypothetical protein, partial [Serratia plymuthica]|uniref:hypothetical protein n=1 Tax=Serratia plymuthica TaxID=82996 RepID=UPI001F21CBAE
NLPLVKGGHDMAPRRTTPNGIAALEPTLCSTGLSRPVNDRVEKVNKTYFMGKINNRIKLYLLPNSLT